MADRTLKVEIIGDASSLNKAFGSVAKSSTGVTKAFGNLAKAGVLVGAALGAAAAVGIKKSIDAASDLQEQVNKTNVVFRGSEKQVKEWSKGLETSFGLSQRAALEAAGTYGNMLVPMGFARDKAAEMSETMVELAGDMASFNNASPAETLDALRAGLAGETEPLRRFGVFLNEARIKAQAMEMGLYKGKGALDAQAKAAASYAIILKDTGDTQGDFARSAGTSMANQMRIFKASLEDVSASLGAIFLPLVIKAFGVINKYVVPALQKAVDWTKNFFKVFDKADGVKGKLGVVGDAFKGLARSIITSIDRALFGYEKLVGGGQSGRVKVRVDGMADKFAAAFADLDWNKVGDEILNGLTQAIKASAELAKQLGSTITDAMRTVNWEAVGQAAGPGLVVAMLAAFNAVLDVSFWMRNWELALAVAINALLLVFGGGLGKAGEAIGAKLLAPFSKLGESMLQAVILGLRRISPVLSDAFITAFRFAFVAVVAIIASLGRLIEGAIKSLFGRLGGLAVFTVRVLGIAAVITAISQMAGKVIDALGRLAGDALNKGKEIIKRLADGIRSNLPLIATVLFGLPGLIARAAAAAVTAAYRVGQNIVHGLVDGMISIGSSAISAAAQFLADLIPGWMKKFLGIGSPSKVMADQVGKPISEGVAKGITDNASKAAQAAADAAKKAVEAARQAVVDAKGVFASAFSELASAAFAAFDRITDEFQTKTEKKISRQDENRANADRKRALKEANDALAKAQAPLTQQEGESPEDFAARVQAQTEAITAALQAQADAKFAIQRATDEKTAAQERKEYEASRERRKVNFTNQLGELETQLEKGRISAKEFRRRVLALFEKFDVPFKSAGKVLGAALSAGLHESFDDAAKAARRLIDAIAGEIAKSKFVIDVTVRGQPGAAAGKPGRQHGGYVRRGMSYVVGERRPEVFVPTQSGRIIPSLAGGGDASAEIHTHVYLDSTQIAEVVRREYLRFEKRNGRSAV